ncbi:MAG: hypothetical protein HC871_14855, partial [Rhizobiales bacterium]|nr:hypothetical protein [Hyphomicrobiales bacterium]
STAQTGWCWRGVFAKRITAEDLAEMVVDGEVSVTCEFCNSRYRFDPASFAKSDDAD